MLGLQVYTDELVRKFGGRKPISSTYLWAMWRPSRMETQSNSKAGGLSVRGRIQRFSKLETDMLGNMIILGINENLDLCYTTRKAAPRNSIENYPGPYIHETLKPASGSSSRVFASRPGNYSKMTKLERTGLGFRGLGI